MRLAIELEAAGFADVEVHQFDAAWHGPAGLAYLSELRDLHRYMAPYTSLSNQDRQMVNDAILAILEEFTVGDQVKIVSPALIAVATKRR